MPLNVPTTTTNNLSFGPARLFIGASGTTPSVDLGAITEDGVKVTLRSTKRHIMQGNPKSKLYTFIQEQAVDIEVSGIEWNVNSIQYGLGSGNTTSVSASDTFSFGGDPIVDKVAIHIQHYGATAGHTYNVYAWQCVSDGDVEIGFTHDEHKFPYKWTAQRVTTDWAGTSLAYDEQLMKIYRQKT